QLDSENRSVVQEAILQSLKSEDWQQIEAAIFVANGTYVYKRKVSDHPLAFEYKCLSPEALQKAFHIERIDTGWLPTNIVRCGSNTAGEWAVLFAPPAQQTLELQETRTVQVPLPGMVMVGVGRDYRIWSVSTKQFEPDATGYHAPLPNVHENGRICWGTNHPSIASPQNIAKAWELFISSPFNGDLVYGKSRSHYSNVRQQLIALSKRRRKTYPSNDLMPACKGYRHRAIAELVEEFIT
ncbi:MAG: hypothetical protein NW224_13385, partial [Leptolyngbyaceae cyanobacterium bins.302]|nr:hypothetical protein [Leptolyngbyaceae cyanobacterium bins.302]